MNTTGLTFGQALAIAAAGAGGAYAAYKGGVVDAKMAFKLGAGVGAVAIGVLVLNEISGDISTAGDGVEKLGLGAGLLGIVALGALLLL